MSGRDLTKWEYRGVLLLFWMIVLIPLGFGLLKTIALIKYIVS